jgi:hypothetical protein
LHKNGHNADGILSPPRRGAAIRDPRTPFAPPDRRFAAIPARRRAVIYSTSTVYNLTEMLMKTLTNLAALSLSFILGLMPFAVIAMNDLVATKV